LGYSASTAYLAECENQKISPRTNGIIRFEKYNDNDILARNNHMGSQYGKAMGNCLRFMKARVCDFSGNNFKDDGAVDVILNMRPCIIELNLCKNNLGNGTLLALI